MKIYLIEVIDKSSIPEYDVNDAQLIIAKTPEQARSLCEYKDEGPDIWKDPRRTSCKVIGYTLESTNPRIVMISTTSG